MGLLELQNLEINSVRNSLSCEDGKVGTSLSEDKKDVSST